MSTTEAQKAYSRGYYRGRNRMYDHIQRLVAVARGYRDRLECSPQARCCKNCGRWKHGGGKTLWGICRADFEYGVEPRAWIEVPSSGPNPKAELVTTEDFACVNWLPQATRLTRGTP